MDTVVLRVVGAAVVNAAARDDRDVAVVADIEIVVDRLLDAAGAHNDGNMDVFALGIRFDEDIDSGAVLLGADIDVIRGVSACELAVDTEVIRTLRFVVDVGDLGENHLGNIV